MRERIRVFVAEDNEDLRAAVVLLLNDTLDMHCIGETDCLAEVVPRVLESSAEVVVLDIELKGQSSLVNLATLKRQLPGAHFLIYSGHSHPELMRGATAAGASGYVLKSGDFDELLQAIRQCVAA